MSDLYKNLLNGFATKSTKWKNVGLTLYGNFMYRLSAKLFLNFDRNSSCELSTSFTRSSLMNLA